MVCLAIGVEMFKLLDYLNAMDKFAIVNQMAVALVMTLFIMFSAYFTFFKVPVIVAMEKLKVLKKAEKQIVKTHESYSEKVMQKKLSTHKLRRFNSVKLMSMDSVKATVGSVMIRN